MNAATDSDLYAHHHLTAEEWRRANDAMQRLEAEDEPKPKPKRSTATKSKRPAKSKPKRKRKKATPKNGDDGGSDSLGKFWQVVLSAGRWQALLDSARPNNCGSVVSSIARECYGKEPAAAVVVGLFELYVSDLVGAVLRNQNARAEAIEAANSLVVQVSARDAEYRKSKR